MKRNKLLVLSLLACSLLASCDEKTAVQDGSKPVGTVEATDKNGNAVSLDTALDLQKLYDTLKASTGGSEALKQLIKKISYLEYYKDGSFAPVSFADGGVKAYHTDAAFKKDIEDKFDSVVNGTSYLDDDGNFDKEKYKEYIAKTLDHDVTDGTSKYLSEEMNAKLGYNYDNYIEEDIIPTLLENYMYLDYLTSSSKYKGQFSNQYAIKLEVLKLPQDTSKVNNSWNEAMIRDVNKVVSKTLDAFGTDYSFVTFNSDAQLVVVTTAADKISYNVYSVEDSEALYNSMFTPDTTTKNIKQVNYDDAVAAVSGATPIADKSWEIGLDATTDDTYYKNMEQLLIARDLWKIDREVVLGANYDYETPWYLNGMTETEKTEAEGFANTYSSSNAKPLKDVVKSQKITAQQVKYYSEPDYYVKGTYTNVLPSALSSLRGTSAKELQSHLYSNWAEGDNFLLPKESDSPLYLDTSSSTYYICEAYSWYGYYKNANVLDSTSKYKSISNYQIDTYQNGSLNEYSFDESKNAYVVESGYPIAYDEHVEPFEDVIGLVEVSANAILTSAMKKEAIIALFTKYGLELNDQDIYNYVSEQYPDYFATED